jgi:hypothetical protein
MTDSFAAIALPLLLLCAVALILPRMIVPRQTRSHSRVIVGMAATALALLLLGPMIYALFDQRGLFAGETAQILLVAWWMFRESLSAILIWGPLLILVWFGLAQRVERLRGEDMTREDT